MQHGYYHCCLFLTVFIFTQATGLDKHKFHIFSTPVSSAMDEGNSNKTSTISACKFYLPTNTTHTSTLVQAEEMRELCPQTGTGTNDYSHLTDQLYCSFLVFHSSPEAGSGKRHLIAAVSVVEIFVKLTHNLKAEANKL